VNVSKEEDTRAADPAHDSSATYGEWLSRNYSTVKSAQRLSATLSIRPSGRVQKIRYVMFGKHFRSQEYEGAQKTCNFVQDHPTACACKELSASSELRKAPPRCGISG
jgi:hypothetical protein